MRDFYKSINNLKNRTFQFDNFSYSDPIPIFQISPAQDKAQRLISGLDVSLVVLTEIYLKLAQD